MKNGEGSDGVCDDKILKDDHVIMYTYLFTGNALHASDGLLDDSTWLDHKLEGLLRRLVVRLGFVVPLFLAPLFVAASARRRRLHDGSRRDTT